MVPTNSLIPGLTFVVSQLSESELSEDQALAKEVGARVSELVRKLQPVLVYVDQPLFNNFRGVQVANDIGVGKLMLDRTGCWHLETPSGHFLSSPNEQTWERFPLCDVTCGLTGAFTTACEKKEEHLRVLNERRTLLEKIEALIKGEESAKQA